jgi:hypothetical protein
LNAHSQILIAIFAGIFLKLTLASGRAQVNVPSSDLRDILCLLLVYHHVTNRIFVHQEYIAHVKEKYYSYMPEEGRKERESSSRVVFSSSKAMQRRREIGTLFSYLALTFRKSAYCRKTMDSIHK